MERGQQLTSNPHQVILQNRQQVELTGVSDVDSFDDTVVVAYTSLGDLTVRGAQLHVKRLDLDSGILSVEGQIDCLQYSESRRSSGFFGRLLR